MMEQDSGSDRVCVVYSQGELNHALRQAGRYVAIYLKNGDFELASDNFAQICVDASSVWVRGDGEITYIGSSSKLYLAGGHFHGLIGDPSEVEITFIVNTGSPECEQCRAAAAPDCKAYLSDVSGDYRWPFRPDQ